MVRQGGAAEGGLTGIDRDGTVGFPYAGIKLPTRFMSLLRAHVLQMPASDAFEPTFDV